MEQLTCEDMARTVIAVVSLSRAQRMSLLGWKAGRGNDYTQTVSKIFPSAAAAREAADKLRCVWAIE